MISITCILFLFLSVFILIWLKERREALKAANTALKAANKTLQESNIRLQAKIDERTTRLNKMAVLKQEVAVRAVIAEQKYYDLVTKIRGCIE